ncbi:MAG: N-acetyltransferase [Pirellulaceae bacterium]
MPNLDVVPVASSKQQRQFLDLPWDLYRGDPHWITRLRSSEQELVGFKRHPFHEENEVQAFLAVRDGKPVGRIVAIVNRGHVERHREKLGFFGFFESIDDQPTANALFDAARQWLAERGMEGVRGPLNPSMNYDCGLLIEGFDSPPTFMMTYNPPYYASLVEGYGFTKSQDMFSYLANVDMMDSMDEKLAFITNEARRRFEFKLRTLDKSRFDAEVRMFLDIYNQSLMGTWGFVPLSKHEIDHMSTSLKHLIVPEMTAVAEFEGRPVGAIFGLLDYNPRIKRIGGRLFPFGFIRLLWNKKSIKRVRLMSTNVLPEFQKWGLGVVLLAELLPTGLQRGMTEGEFSWVLESNHLSRKSLERGGAKKDKTFRIYDFAM